MPRDRPRVAHRRAASEVTVGFATAGGAALGARTTTEVRITDPR